MSKRHIETKLEESSCALLLEETLFFLYGPHPLIFLEHFRNEEASSPLEYFLVTLIVKIEFDAEC